MLATVVVALVMVNLPGIGLPTEMEVSGVGGKAPRGGRGARGIYFPLFFTGVFFLTGALFAVFFTAFFLAGTFFLPTVFFTVFFTAFFFGGVFFFAGAFFFAVFFTTGFFGFAFLAAGGLGGGGGGGGGGTFWGDIGMGSIQPAPDQPISKLLIGSSSPCWCDAPRRRTAQLTRA